MQRFDSAFSGGNGTESDPYKISSLADLEQLRRDVNGGNTYGGKYLKVTKDITLSDNWTPIGTVASMFNGTFDGDGKTISGLTTNGGSYQGLFGHVENATIKNVRLMNVNVSGKYRVSAVVASANNNSQILNCSTSGNVKASGNSANVGGLVGVNDESTIKDSAYLGGTITGANKGAITGKNGGTLTGNYYYGTLADGVNGNGATQIFNVTLPKGVTSSSLVEINGTNYIKAGNVTLNYGGQNYSYNVNADLTVTLQDDKLYVGGEQLNPAAQLTAVANENSALKSSADLTAVSTYATANAEKGVKLYASDKGDTLTGGAGSVTLKDFTTNEFAINSETWTLSGNTLTKK